MELTNTNKRIHRTLISICMSIFVWGLLNAFLVKISFGHWIIFEICIAFGEIFSNFIKGELGIQKSTNQEEEDEF